MDVVDIAAVAGAAVSSTLVAVYWMLSKQQQAAPGTSLQPSDSENRVSFLFEDENLEHASETAAKLYKLIPGHDDWTGMRERLVNRFPNLPERPLAAQSGQTTVPARDIEDAAILEVTRAGAFTRINMVENEVQTSAQSLRFKNLQHELEDLRRASDTTPHAIWQVDSEGSVTWHNAAYTGLYNRLHQKEPDPVKPVFDVAPSFHEKSGRQRVSAQLPDNEHVDWYDVTVASVGDIMIFHAIDVNAVVKSEAAQRNFVQTLAKTFAQLSIGLAIFDRNGQLALFNPALIDLTELPADFLSGRPTLMSFFDRIRENRRMPEPKNYHSWRQQITDVIAAATDGRYQETWTLETGQTYRVSGRPHPDGAIAFLIEDISAEVSVTRNFRAELELGQSLMDTFDEALVVFSSTGVLTFCNLAYRELWGLDPDNSFADVTINDSVRAWQEDCAPNKLWDGLIDFVLDFGEKTSWDMTARLHSGAEVKCTVSRISSGATVVRFALLEQAGAPALKQPSNTQSD
ncbi:PAS domain-containing protein [Roseobacter denitrificans]|nr:PAS-domain containing protein [Roseobacter denitrificans]AVL53360.1 PAS domain-containing protein [Roseobacter denitrificans]SFF70230.1 PAS domain-containing protein [Roseobacter denitrificans OCh 114]